VSEGEADGVGREGEMGKEVGEDFAGERREAGWEIGERGWEQGHEGVAGR
jgi:hypothetical protein